MKEIKLNSILTALILIILSSVSRGSTDGRCSDYRAGQPNLYWGDLHIHTAYSLDAYAFGTKTATPIEAYAYAKGGSLVLPDGETRITQQRPLDFVSITDHAETFDFMYICTDPTQANRPLCQEFRYNSGTDAEGAGKAFWKFLMPVIGVKPPAKPALCSQPGVDCQAAAKAQWQRIQDQANDSNEECEFTALIGHEWSATPDNQHWHRNIIYANANVSEEAINYVDYPSPVKLWQALQDQCKSSDGCDVIAIPHNTNLSEGGGFDVETETIEQQQLRSTYERLIEIHQSKGNSECLSENWDDNNADCGFEMMHPLTASKQKEAPSTEQIQQAKRSYVRNILSRGLIAYQQSAELGLNPLQLGIIGSTDNHVAAPGSTEENNWKGDAWSGGDTFKQRRFKRMHYNPGGLVAVWADENTRSSIFDALKNRRSYGTSGTRIHLRFAATNQATTNNDFCAAGSNSLSTATPMGGSFNRVNGKAPKFVVIAAQDDLPLSHIEIIKGTLKKGEIIETVYSLKNDTAGFAHSCSSWTDPDFDAKQPAYWYTRVREVASPRWSKYLCEDLGNCNEHPEANQLIQERAWSSPIWYLP